MLHIRGLDLFSAAPNGEKKYGRIHFYDENRQFLAQINPNSFSQVVTAPEYDEQVRTYRLTVSNSGEQMTQYGNLAYVRITGPDAGDGGEVAVAVDEEIRYETTKPWDYAQVDVDFTQGVRAEVVGCFSGHLHRDVMAQVGQVQVVVTSCDGNPAYDPSEEPRTPGTAGGAGAHCEHQPAGPDSSAHPGGTGGGSELYLLRRRTHARGGSGCCPSACWGRCWGPWGE